MEHQPISNRGRKVIRDITEEQLARERLQRAEARRRHGPLPTVAEWRCSTCGRKYTISKCLRCRDDKAKEAERKTRWVREFLSDT